MRHLCLGLLAALALPAAHAACAAGTQTVFACTTTQGKTVEVCDAGASLSYRFGKPAGPPELSLTLPRAQASTTQWNGAGRSIGYSVEIPNGQTVYSVFISMDRLSEQHGIAAGIDVYGKGQRIATLRCTPGSLVQNLEGIDLKATTW